MYNIENSKFFGKLEADGRSGEGKQFRDTSTNEIYFLVERIMVWPPVGHIG